MLSLQAKGDLEAMVMKGYSAFPKAPASLESHHQIVLCRIQDTLWNSYTQQKVSRCILQLQPTVSFCLVFLVDYFTNASLVSTMVKPRI